MGAAASAHDAAAGQSHPRIENCVWQVSILTPYDTGPRHSLTPARLLWRYGHDGDLTTWTTSGARYGHDGDLTTWTTGSSCGNAGQISVRVFEVVVCVE